MNAYHGHHHHQNARLALVTLHPGKCNATLNSVLANAEATPFEGVARAAGMVNYY